MKVTPARRAVLFATVVTLPLAACGSGSSGGAAKGSPSGAGTSASTATGTSGAAFPRTVKTSYGSVRIPSAPRRIVVLGAQSAEAVLALGGKPVAIDTGGSAYTPWLQDKVGDAAHQTLSDSKSVKVEAIAADRPDLIVVANWIMQLPGVASRLRALAPTVDVPENSVNPDWDKVIESTADALGKPAAGTALVSSLKSRMASAGKGIAPNTTYNWVRFDAQGWGMGNGSLLDSFGLKPAHSQNNSNTEVLSAERTNELTGDALFVWAYGKTAADVRAAPGAAQLPSVKKGTLQIVDLNFALALNSPGAYGIPWLIDQIRPTLAKLKSQ
ncbi:ABC transporter substrate-binding protein [Flexivirga caeni]|uniref:ABC transporter substrate-binding protein n=1 Tax=Flexivirga caeni TaxID=2294115 RepID=A0A3M9M7F9_9MICO|nr:ABC transporter substrate-binding protein [Flexivirga caeni]RNI21157.1 ABC transporter substrate-binding protein [Flexivirga caeni]